jgi:hypothetical protein
MYIHHGVRQVNMESSNLASLRILPFLVDND